MLRFYLLIITAVIETATGIALLALPSVPLALLLGLSEAAPETLLVGRVAGAALLAIGVSCWFGRGDAQGKGPAGLLIGVLIYDVAAAVILAYTGLFLNLAGIALWPAVVLHTALAGWCVVCVGSSRTASALDPADH